jgi:DNA-binding transcriptional regulator YiaG
MASRTSRWHPVSGRCRVRCTERIAAVLSSRAATPYEESRTARYLKRRAGARPSEPIYAGCRHRTRAGMTERCIFDARTLQLASGVPDEVELAVITMQLWTGREAHALREVLRMSQREFAAHLGVATRTVAKWDSEGANVTPRGEIQRVLDTALARAETDVHNRFEHALGRSTEPEAPTQPSEPASAASVGQRERFLLGDGHLTIAVPKRAGERDLVATEDSATAQHLVEIAHSMRLTAGVEYIPTSGLINLNREALIVVCGPKSSPVIAAAIARDPRLAFEPSSQGRWELEERRSGQRYRSPMDEPDMPQPADVAYLGRLPRPDGAGAFLLIAGVHAIGSLGASRYLARHLPYLHAATGGRPFSMVIGCRYDEMSKSILDVYPVTAPLLHQEA